MLTGLSGQMIKKYFKRLECSVDMDLAIITPSYISNFKRLKLAVRSLESLRSTVGQKFPHIVVDDIPRMSLPVPRGRSISTPIPNIRFKNAAKEVYDEPNIRLLRRHETNNVSAVMECVQLAKERGADLVFFHMDDNIYLPIMSKLINWAKIAFKRKKSLKHIHLSGWPMISDQCSKTEGNRSLIEIKRDQIVIDDHTFTGNTYSDFTLWSSPFCQSMSSGDFWPIVAWCSIFRIEFLEWLLTRDPVSNLSDMGRFESHYRSEKNWNEVVERGGEVGYINMQFGGFEMHRNENWRELITYPNDAIHSN